jgi:hypothetical protein
VVFWHYNINIFSVTAQAKEDSKVHHELPLEENVNRLEPEGEEARSVEDAIAVLRY